MCHFLAKNFYQNIKTFWFLAQVVSLTFSELYTDLRILDDLVLT